MNIERAALHGWAFNPEATKISEAICEHYKNLLARKEGFKITARYNPSDYNCTTYRGIATKDFTDGDIAILCDSGNCCFGAQVEREGDTFRCKVFTD